MLSSVGVDNLAMENDMISMMKALGSKLLHNIQEKKALMFVIQVTYKVEAEFFC